MDGTKTIEDLQKDLDSLIEQQPKKAKTKPKKAYSKKRKLEVTKEDQFDFWMGIAKENADVPYNVRIQAMDKAIELCGEQDVRTAKYVLRMEFPEGK